eukprot:6172313-Pleurochrysis_carterae.AAC.2
MYADAHGCNDGGLCAHAAVGEARGSAASVHDVPGWRLLRPKNSHQLGWIGSEHRRSLREHIGYCSWHNGYGRASTLLYGQAQAAGLQTPAYINTAMSIQHHMILSFNTANVQQVVSSEGDAHAPKPTHCTVAISSSLDTAYPLNMAVSPIYIHCASRGSRTQLRCTRLHNSEQTSTCCQHQLHNSVMEQLLIRS